MRRPLFIIKGVAVHTWTTLQAFGSGSLCTQDSCKLLVIVTSCNTDG
jgi:hypothetical protein